MQNTTRLLERHADHLEGRRGLVVDADDNALSGLGGELIVHSDRADIRASQHAALPVLPVGVELLILILPKSRERLAWLLQGLAAQLAGPVDCWLVGPGKGGIRGALATLSGYLEDVQQLDSARHCKLFGGRLLPRAEGSGGQQANWRCGRLEIVSLPGVFAHGRLDEGTALLLDAMDELHPAGRVLDMGCGSGVISAWLADRGCEVSACDVSATAVESARQTLRANGLLGDVVHSDLYNALPPGTFDLVCSNPPFHTGLEQTTAISHALISGAVKRLRRGGRLVLVANQGLPYGDWLHECFVRVEVLRETRRFRVWQAFV